MPRWKPPTRTRAIVVALASLCTTLAAPGPVLAAGLIAKAPQERAPLDLGGSHASTASSGSSGASVVRTIVGLLIVLAVIWGVTWVLKQVKSGRTARAGGSGLTSMATLPLGSGRSLQLVRAGNEYVLLGVAEHGVVPVHRYSEREARAAGLFDLSSNNPMLADEAPGSRLMQIPGQPGSQGLLERVRRWTVRS
jgi:flagellar protein FliO/FliZ